MKIWNEILMVALFAGISLDEISAQNKPSFTLLSPIQSNELTPKIQIGGNEFSGYNLARNILGGDFIMPGEVTKARSLSYTKEQHRHFMETFPSEEMLRWCKANGYGILPGPPRPMGS